jgi:hypothetical protein
MGVTMEGSEDSGSEAGAASRPAASRAARIGSPAGSDHDREHHEMHISDDDDGEGGYGRDSRGYQQQQRQAPAAAGARFAIGVGRGSAAAADGDWPRLQSENGKIVARGFRPRGSDDAQNPMQQQPGGWRQKEMALAAGYGAEDNAYGADRYAADNDGYNSYNDAGDDGGWEGPAALQQGERGLQRQLSGGSQAESETEKGLDAASMSEAATDDENADITCDWR